MKTGTPRFFIGIDLGTTQCALSYFDTEFPEDGIVSFGIDQFVSSQEIEAMGTMPSLLFLPDESFPAPSPPWGLDSNPIVGHYAHDLGGEVPSRLIHSAKSWLCHSRVDRNSPLLPWQSDVADKWSPVEVTAYFLKHLIAVWQFVKTKDDKSCDFFRQKVTIAVPASFDPVARNLTMNAIKLAGINEFSLLEEPQAAFYDYLHRNSKKLEQELKCVNTALVVDIGGGTTDFSLIGLKKGPTFTRLAVGPHLLIGGDNVDLAIAKTVEARFRHRGKRLHNKQWLKILRDARMAKERIFSGSHEGEIVFTVSGAGGKVIATTIKEAVPVSELKRIVLEGFFPACSADSKAEDDGLPGLSEAGLPYNRDPVIPRHLAQFLAENNIIPDAVLFNGGTTQAAELKERILENLRNWHNQQIKVLENPHPTLAVSIGAVYFSMATMGMGLSIQSGCPVSIYLGVGGTEKNPATPDQFLCLLPKNSKSEEEFKIPEKLFGVDRSRDVGFYLFYANSPPKGEFPGFEAPRGLRRFRPLPPLTLPHDESESAITLVQLGVMLGETGFLQVFCRDQSGILVKELTFDVSRAGVTDKKTAWKGLGKRQTGQIKKLFDSFFLESSAKIAFNLAFKKLEEVLASSRKDWDLPMLRGIFDLLAKDDRFHVSSQKLQGNRKALEGAKRPTAGDEPREFFAMDGIMSRSPGWARATTSRGEGGRVPPFNEKFRFHVSNQALCCLLRLMGFCLRPGFGDARDEARIDSLWEFWKIDFSTEDTGFWSDWWIMWRRISTGLSPDRQLELFKQIEPLVQNIRKAGRKPRKIDQHERNQIWRLLGNLELLPIDEKVKMGKWIIQQTASFGRDSTALYALGRLGGRQMFYADQTLVVPQNEVTSWAETLLKYANAENSYLDWTLKEFGRKTGDRLTQIDELNRKRILELLKRHRRKNEFIAPLIKAQAFRREELAESLGESLPNGFVWVKDLPESNDGLEQQP